MNRLVGGILVFAVCTTVAFPGDNPGGVHSDSFATWQLGQDPIRYYVVGFDANARQRLTLVIERAIGAWRGVGAPLLPQIVQGDAEALSRVALSEPESDPLRINGQETFNKFLLASRPSNHPLYRSIVVMPDWRPIGDRGDQPNVALALNGYQINPNTQQIRTAASVVLVGDVRNDLMEYAVTHELGHSIGLGHSLVHRIEEMLGRPAPSLPNAPLMFPVVSRSVAGFHPNDRAWLAFLYRDGPIVAPFAVIRAALRTVDGNRGLEGLNVFAVRDTSGVGQDLRRTPVDVERYSCLTGFFEEGRLVLPVRSGTYRFFVQSVPQIEELEESIIPGGFVGGAALGPSIVGGSVPATTVSIYPWLVPWQPLQVYRRRTVTDPWVAQSDTFIAIEDRQELEIQLRPLGSIRPLR